MQKDDPNLEVVNVGVELVVFLQDLFECLQVGADTKPSLEVLDVPSPGGGAVMV